MLMTITADLHGSQVQLVRLLTQLPKEGEHIILICGDAGFLFTDLDFEHRFLEELESLENITIAFVDGNHENFPAIERCPIETWNGGKVHRLCKNMLHLMRGEVFTIGSKSFFAMGGAYSIDRAGRECNVTYWEKELPSEEEMKQALDNLARHNFSVDYIITHTAPKFVYAELGIDPHEEEVPFLDFLNELYFKVDFKHWYCGHHHIDRRFDQKLTILRRITENILI